MIGRSSLAQGLRPPLVAPEDGYGVQKNPARPSWLLTLETYE